MASSVASIPTSWADLDKAIPMADIDSIVANSSKSAEGVVRSLETASNGVKGSVSPVLDSFRSMEGGWAGYAVLIWLPAWVTVALTLVGVVLGSNREWGKWDSAGSVGHACHWAAFVVGTLWVCCVTLPLFSAA